MTRTQERCVWIGLVVVLSVALFLFWKSGPYHRGYTAGFQFGAECVRHRVTDARAVNPREFDTILGLRQKFDYDVVMAVTDAATAAKPDSEEGTILWIQDKGQLVVDPKGALRIRRALQTADTLNALLQGIARQKKLEPRPAKIVVKPFWF